MTAISTRLRMRAVQDFGTGAPEIVGWLENLQVGGEDASERIQAAILLFAQGRVSMIRDSIALSQVDWRDVLVRGGLADEDWRERLDAELGPADCADTTPR